MKRFLSLILCLVVAVTSSICALAKGPEDVYSSTKARYEREIKKAKKERKKAIASGIGKEIFGLALAVGDCYFASNVLNNYSYINPNKEDDGKRFGYRPAVIVGDKSLVSAIRSGWNAAKDCASIAVTCTKMDSEYQDDFKFKDVLNMSKIYISESGIDNETLDIVDKCAFWGGTTLAGVISLNLIIDGFDKFSEASEKGERIRELRSISEKELLLGSVANSEK